jgi:hypothetical protein
MDYKNKNRFLETLTLINNLTEKCLNITTNKRNKKEFLFKNSFIFSNQMGHYIILNSVSEIIEEIKVDNIIFNRLKEIFLTYYDKCPDLSNIFFILLTKIISKCESNSRSISSYLNNNYISLTEKLNENFYKKVIYYQFIIFK